MDGIYLLSVGQAVETLPGAGAAMKDLQLCFLSLLRQGSESMPAAPWTSLDLPPLTMASAAFWGLRHFFFFLRGFYYNYH